MLSAIARTFSAQTSKIPHPYTLTLSIHVHASAEHTNQPNSRTVGPFELIFFHSIGNRTAHAMDTLLAGYLAYFGEKG